MRHLESKVRPTRKGRAEAQDGEVLKKSPAPAGPVQPLDAGRRRMTPRPLGPDSIADF